MGRHATTFEKECLCFRCPLEDCRSPCPFGVDKGKCMENIDEYLFNNYVEIKGKDEKKRRRRITNRKYYLKRKGIKDIEHFNKDMFGDLKEGE